jgi:hypothetical protein
VWWLKRCCMVKRLDARGPTLNLNAHRTYLRATSSFRPKPSYLEGGCVDYRTGGSKKPKPPFPPPYISHGAVSVGVMVATTRENEAPNQPIPRWRKSWSCGRDLRQFRVITDQIWRRPKIWRGAIGPRRACWPDMVIQGPGAPGAVIVIRAYY